MLSFHVEPWNFMEPEIRLLIEEHWQEVALYKDTIPLDVMWDSYRQMEKAGILHCLAVRDDGKLVGYFIGMVKPHLHYAKSLTFFTDVYFLTQKYRKGTTGVKLFTEMRKSLKNRGVQRMIVSTKTHLDMSQILSRLGFDETERVFMTLL